MICAKNYETAAKFVKVTPKILWHLFPDTVYYVVGKIKKNASLPGEECGYVYCMIDTIEKFSVYV